MCLEGFNQLDLHEIITTILSSQVSTCPLDLIPTRLLKDILSLDSTPCQVRITHIMMNAAQTKQDNSFLLIRRTDRDEAQLHPQPLWARPAENLFFYFLRRSFVTTDVYSKMGTHTHIQCKSVHLLHRMSSCSRDCIPTFGFDDGADFSFRPMHLASPFVWLHGVPGMVL